MEEPWYKRLYTPPRGPDRVERLLTSCRDYYRNGDVDIAILLCLEVEKALRQPNDPFIPPR